MKTRAELVALAAQKLVDNGIGQVTVEDVRDLIEEIIDSVQVKATDTADQVTEGASKLHVTAAEKSAWSAKLTASTQADTLSGDVLFTASKIYGRPEAAISDATITIDRTNAEIGASVVFFHTGGLPTFAAASDEIFYRVTNRVEYDDTLTNEIIMIYVGGVGFVWSARPIGGVYVAPRRNGWGNYQDAGTASTPILLTADTYATITNDGLGASTEETYLPDGVTSLLDTATGKIDLSSLNVGDVVECRFDFILTPGGTNYNAFVNFNLGSGGSAFSLELGLPKLDSGAGIPYQRVFSLPFYIGSEDVRDNGIEIQVKLSGAGEVVNNGVFVTVHRSE